MIELSTYKFIFSTVRDVLLDKWDPVGIGDNPNLRDEYDAYIPAIIQLLSSKPISKLNIFDYLMGVEIDQMGMPEDPERVDLAAEALAQIVISEPKSLNEK